MNLRDLLARDFLFPSVPRVVALLLNALDQTEVDLKKVNQLIGTDPALTTRLLRLANSDFFKLRGKINSVSEALALLNLDQVRQMAQEAATTASLKAVPGVDLQRFWDYSLDTAKVSRSLAGVVRQNQQAAFTCGLIHAFGELAMHLAMPREIAELAEQCNPLNMRRAAVERHHFGYCYANVGAGFVRMWGFPQALVDAIEYQYAPFENQVYEPLAGVIHLASWRARGKQAKLSPNLLASTFPGGVGVALGLDIDMVLQQDPFDWAAHT